MKKSILLSFLFVGLFAFASCNGTSGNKQAAASETAQTDKAQSGTIHLTRAEFLTKVADYEKNPNEWKYLGDKPAIIDFYADWCAPCRMVGPIVSEIANERRDVKVGKINVDEQPELAAQFQVMSIPMLAVIKNGKLKNQVVGYRSKKQIEEML